MAKSCTINPDKKSKLFPKLVSYFKENGFTIIEARKTAKEIWPIVVSSDFQSKNEVEYYDNPECKFKEPLMEDVIVALDLNKLVSERNDVVAANNEAGNTYESKKVFDTYAAAANEATLLNEKFKKANARVVNNGKGYSIEVTNRTTANMNQPSELVFQSELCNRLLNIVRNAGFEVKVEDVVRSNGRFSPENAEVTAKGLMTVIQIAKGEKGEEQFPEEFSHMVIAGTKHMPLTMRLVNTLNNNSSAVEEILGDQYDYYKNLYENEGTGSVESRLAEEAAGKLLKDKLINRKAPSNFEFLLTKLWNKVKSMFSKVPVSDVKVAIMEAERAAYNLANVAETKEIIPYLSDIEILKSDTFYYIEQELNRLQKLSKKVSTLYAKKLQLERAKSPGNKYSNESQERFRLIEDNIKKNDHYSTYLNFMNDAIVDFRNLRDALRTEYIERKNSNLDERKDIKKLAATAHLLRQFQEFNSAYLPIIEEMSSFETLKEFGELEELTEEQVETITQQAKMLYEYISKASGSVIKDLQFNTCLDFLRMYAGNELLKKAVEGDKESKDLIESLLKRGTDINVLNLTFDSLTNSSDLILQLIDKAVKTVHAKRDLQLVDFKNMFLAYTSDFVKKGGDPRFLLERIDGKKTGRIISNIDWEAYEKAKQAEIERIESIFPDKPKSVKMQLLEDWINNNTVEEVVNSRDLKGNRTSNDSNRVERIPRQQNEDGTGPLWYTKPEGQRLKDLLNKDELDYYHKFMFLKRGLDAAMPASEVSLYLAPQRLNSMLDGVMASDNKGKAFGKAVKDIYKIRTDLGERGYFPSRDADGNALETQESFREYEKQVTTGIDGQPLNKIPVYLTRKLEDMDRLSEDMAGGLIAYAGMVYNYIGMSEVVDLLEITRDWVENQREYEKSTGIKMVDRFKTLGKEVEIRPTVKGLESNVAKRLDKYYEMVVYGRMKADQEVALGNTKIDQARLLDMLKAYTGALGLGINVFAGISNELMGKIQMFIESRAKEYFNTKDFAQAGITYTKEIWSYLGEFNSVNKQSKMALMIDKFDMLYEFFNNMKYEEYYKSDLARIIGKGNLYILNNLGEHVLHVQGGIAMLKHIKARIPVKDKNGNITGYKDTNMYDAFYVKKSKDEETGTKSYDIALPEGTEMFDEKTGQYREFTEDDVVDMKMKIGVVNNKMHGAFNEADRGLIQNNAYGRLLMQFRQWMPEYFNKRYGKKGYSAILDTEVEGFYRTAGRFLLDTFRDIRRGEFQLKMLGKNLKPWEKANMKRFGAELSIYIGLILAVALLKNFEDEKGYWGRRMLAYQLKRLRMEVGAGTPTPVGLFNIIQILQSPAAAINSFGGIFNILKFWNASQMIESGRYKGWSKYHRDVYKALPVIQQVHRVRDIANEDYMFLLFQQ